MKHELQYITTKRWNPKTNSYEEFQALDRQSLDDCQRLEISQEFLESGLPARKIVEKYKLSSRQLLFNWLDKFLNEENELPNELGNVTPGQKINDKDQEIKELRKTLRATQKLLELEKVRSKAFSTMIDLAEARFNIPIRKKSGTKQ